MKTEIEEIQKIEKRLRDLKSPSPFTGNAISALSAARDNLNWEIEDQAKKAATEKAAAGKAAAKKDA